ncbi:MAG TPA: IS256 family transposase, partial [Candidatus Acidoferrales bacterium]|nr:IS256 family transposase [Candidatus Acidoferrales bacterium]
RTQQTQGCSSRDTLLAMMFKLGQCAELHWRRIRGFHYLAKVITGVRLTDGIEDVNNELEDSRSAA